MMLNWVLSILSFCLMLGGSFPERHTPCQVVTQITVQWTQENTDQQRIYTDQSKMNKMLIYLRSLEPLPRNDDEETEKSTEYQIILTLSDGTVVRYTQQGLTNFRKGVGDWQRINPENAIRLPLILEAIPGDFI